MDKSEFFTRGFASRLLKEQDALLRNAHSTPRKIESAAGKLAATLGTAKPAQPQNTHAEIKRRRSKPMNPAQLRLKL